MALIFIIDPWINIIDLSLIWTCLSCLSIYWYFFNRAYEWTALLSATPGAYAVLIGFAVFYSDWVLAAVDGNWVGLPSGDQKYLYWVYLAAKRLPMASW
jgi:hypothetical protein